MALAGHGHRFDVIDAVRSGVQGCLLKSTAVETLFQAIRIASAGGTFVDPALRSVPVIASQGERSACSELTSREIRILRFMADGRTNDEIAKLACVSKSTVKFHLRNVFRKLAVTNRTMALKVAADNGLLVTRLPEAPVEDRMHRRFIVP